jgi:hypothetical protein
MAAQHDLPLGELMNADLVRAWRRGAVALAVPAAFFLLLGLACVRGAAWRTWGNHRAPGVVINLSLTNNRGSHPTIEYAVGGNTYTFQTAWIYPAKRFAVGQNVTVLYPADRPDFGMLDSFGELWPLPIGLSVVGLALAALAWKARSGLHPVLHGPCSFGLVVLGALAGMTVFCLLCVPGGLEIFAGAPRLVTFLGGVLLFFGTVPVAACGAFALWQRYVPARCPRCSGPMRGQHVGRQLIYTCSSCGQRG